MSTQTPIFIQPDHYQLLQLVLVNSASAAYVELPLNETAAILGSNNDGKTSLLNALKLFLLPEINFKGCEYKFGFASHGKTYSGLESFKYYFPSQKSFIILEATNTQGDFCLVLHQNPSAELGYSRLAVPVAYAHLRPLFWDSNSSCNQGTGQHPEHLNLATIQKNLLKLKGQRLSDPESIRNALYTRVSPAKPESRFCLIPLVLPPKPSMVRSIKALLQLSFDLSGKSIENLPLAIANIIDSELATEQHTVTINLKKIQTDRQRLRQDADHLDRLRSQQQNWFDFTEAQSNYERVIQQFQTNYYQLKYSLEKLNAACKSQLAALEQQRTHLELQEQPLKTQLQQIQQSIANQHAEQKQSQRLLQEITISMQQAEQALQADDSAPSDPYSLAVRFKAHKKDCELHLDTLLNQEKTQAKLIELNQQRVTNEALLQHLESTLNNDNEVSLLTHLSAQAAHVLNSLSPSFQQLKKQPSAAQCMHIEHFANLFAFQQDQLYFIDEALDNHPLQKFSHQIWLDDLKNKRSAIKEKVKKIQDEMHQLKKILSANSEHSEAIIKKEREKIQHYSSVITALGSYEHNQQKVVELNSQQATLETALTKNTHAFQQLQQSIDQLAVQITTISDQRQQLYQEQRLLDSAQQTLATLDRTIDEQLRPSPNTEETSNTQPSSMLAVDDLASIQRDLEKNAQIYQQLHHKKTQLLQTLLGAQVIVVEPDQAYAPRLKSTDFWTIYQKLQSQFDNLEDKIQEHKGQVRQHNHETSLEMTLLEEMAKAIRNFEAKINLDLSSIKVSNLTGIKIIISTLESFATLQRDLAAHGSTSDQLMNESFYTRLENFCEKYLKEGPYQGKLDLEKVITEVNFIYKLNGIEESVPQSNGTNSMINAVLLSLLLKRLIPEDIVLSIPVVFDEIGSLDKNNLSELRRVVEQNGFQLLVANPNLTGPISAQINRWHDLFLCSLTDAPAIGKGLAIYLADTESCIDLEPVI